MQRTVLMALMLASAACSLSHGRDDSRGTYVVDAGSTPGTSFTDGSVAPAGDARVLPEIDSGALVAVEACEPMRAAPLVCAPTCDDGLPTYAWNGYRCVQIEPCTCEGPDCDRTYGSRAECRRRTTDCPSSVCLRTGGHWYPEPDYCDHYDCSGVPVRYGCPRRSKPACNCGHGRIFDPTAGCLDYAGSCELAGDETQCNATGGTWTCAPPTSEPCDPGCQCPRGRRFTPGFGCVPDWPDACGAPPCPIDEGERCDPTAPSCADGLICCAWGRRGPTCGTPLCDGEGSGCVAVE